MKNLKEKLELDKERMSVLNEVIVFGNEESFIAHIEMFKDFNYDISHYENATKKALSYLNKRRELYDLDFNMRGIFYQQSKELARENAK